MCYRSLVQSFSNLFNFLERAAPAKVLSGIFPRWTYDINLVQETFHVVCVELYLKMILHLPKTTQDKLKKKKPKQQKT